MKLITAFELETRNEFELRVLFRDVSDALARSDRHSPERRIALASLENIERALCARTGCTP